MKKKTITYYVGYRYCAIEYKKKLKIPIYKKSLKNEYIFYALSDLLRHYYCGDI